MGRNPLVMIIDEYTVFRQELQAMLTPARLAVVAECGYGVTVYRQLPTCPMCAGDTWEQSTWSPFRQAAAPA